MKTTLLSIIGTTALIVLAQPARGDPQRGGGVGFAVPAPHVSSAPAAHPAYAAHPSFNVQRTYSLAAPYHRTYVPGSTATSRQREVVRPTTTTHTVQSANERTSVNAKARSNYSAARHDRHVAHDRNWWRSHFSRFVLIGGGYYYWDDDFWWPAWGYDPSYDYYAYDGPIYAPDNMMPDQVISNVQIELQQEGYYTGPINGSLDAPTRAAIATYQRDHGLAINGTVDQSTAESLGFS